MSSPPSHVYQAGFNNRFFLINLFRAVRCHQLQRLQDSAIGLAGHYLRCRSGQRWGAKWPERNTKLLIQLGPHVADFICFAFGGIMLQCWPCS